MRKWQLLGVASEAPRRLVRLGVHIMKMMYLDDLQAALAPVDALVVTTIAPLAPSVNPAVGHPQILQ
jgi:hypothetical protein